MHHHYSGSLSLFSLYQWRTDIASDLPKSTKYLDLIWTAVANYQEQQIIWWTVAWWPGTCIAWCTHVHNSSQLEGPEGIRTGENVCCRSCPAALCQKRLSGHTLLMFLLLLILVGLIFWCSFWYCQSGWQWLNLDQGFWVQSLVEWAGLHFSSSLTGCCDYKCV